MPKNLNKITRKIPFLQPLFHSTNVLRTLRNNWRKGLGEAQGRRRKIPKRCVRPIDVRSFTDIAIIASAEQCTDTRETKVAPPQASRGDKVLKSVHVARLINQESSDVRRWSSRYLASLTTAHWRTSCFPLFSVVWKSKLCPFLSLSFSRTYTRTLFLPFCFFRFFLCPLPPLRLVARMQLCARTPFQQKWICDFYERDPIVLINGNTVHKFRRDISVSNGADDDWFFETALI